MRVDICAAPDCSRDRHYRQPYCKAHYARWRRHGDPTAGKRPHGSTSEPCEIPECNRAANGGRGYCGAHYQRLRKHGDPLAVLRPSAPERLWSRIDKRGPSECWPWTGKVNEHGYGILVWDGRLNARAHRIVYVLLHGAISDDLSVRHTCDNPPCCNPAHLIPGTHAENMDDMVERARRVRRWTDDELEAVRRDTRSGPAVAAEYGMSTSYVYLIRKQYRHGMHRSFIV